MEYNHRDYTEKDCAAGGRHAFKGIYMTAIQNFFQNLLYQIPKIGISDIIDILVVSFLIYTVLRLVRSSSAARVAWTVLVLLIATWLTSVFDLYACNWF